MIYPVAAYNEEEKLFLAYASGVFNITQCHNVCRMAKWSSQIKSVLMPADDKQQLSNAKKIWCNEASLV